MFQQTGAQPAPEAADQNGHGLSDEAEVAHNAGPITASISVGTPSDYVSDVGNGRPKGVRKPRQKILPTL
jgi:hypothetical protein